MVLMTRARQLHLELRNPRSHGSIKSSGMDGGSSSLLVWVIDLRGTTALSLVNERTTTTSGIGNRIHLDFCSVRRCLLPERLSLFELLFYESEAVNK